MLEKLARALTRKPKLVTTIAVLLLIPSMLGAVATRINYDILSFLPDDMESSQGEALLEEPFHMAATTMLIVEDMPPEYANRLVDRVEDVDGVSQVIWLSNLVGIQFPQEMIPENIRDVFFSGDATMMIVQYDQAGGSDLTMKAIDEVRGICNEQCFLAGFSTFTKDTKDLITGEMPMYVVLAAILSMVAMCVMMDSWLLPVALMLSIGLAIVYNAGTNLLLGEISYITQAISAVLQLGVTMDYCIFLYDRYREEVPHHEDKRDAMSVAIVAAFKSLFGSSLTTIAGFLALCFMRLTLGKDIGLVMAKGVVLGVATVVLVLPAILLQMDNAIQKHRHPCLHPNTTRINTFMVRHKKSFVALFLLLFIPAIYASNHAPVYYKVDEALPQDMPSNIANNKLKDEFDMASSHFIILHDDFSHAEMKALAEEIEDMDGITSVVSYDKLMPAGIPDFFIPDRVKDLCKKDGWQLMMVNSAYPAATDDVSNQLDELGALVKSYDPEAYVTGEAAMTRDLITTMATDFTVTNYLSIIAIFLIVAFTFRSFSIPVLLVATIELAIFINQGIPYFTDNAISFIAPTVIGCVQLGATVDYAILMTTRFQEELQKGSDRLKAIEDAAAPADVSIMTSALVFFCATLGVASISTMDIVKGICLMLSRGAIISALVCIFILPSVLVTFEPLIAKTTFYWRAPKPPKEHKLQVGKAVKATEATGAAAPTEATETVTAETAETAETEAAPALQGKESDPQ